MEKKMTKKEIFAELLTVDGVKENEMFVNFIQHEIELLNKPRSKRTGQTAKQIENQKIGEQIVEVIADYGHSMNIKMIKEAAPEYEDLSSQKLSAILRKFVEDGILVKEVIKKITYYNVVK